MAATLLSVVMAPFRELELFVQQLEKMALAVNHTGSLQGL